VWAWNRWADRRSGIKNHDALSQGCRTQCFLLGHELRSLVVATMSLSETGVSSLSPARRCGSASSPRSTCRQSAARPPRAPCAAVPASHPHWPDTSPRIGNPQPVIRGDMHHCIAILNPCTQRFRLGQIATTVSPRMPSRFSDCCLANQKPKVGSLIGQRSPHVMAHKSGSACKKDFHSLESLTILNCYAVSPGLLQIAAILANNAKLHYNNRRVIKWRLSAQPPADR